MRKLSKALLSLLLVVMMLAGYIPFANLTTEVEAAGSGGTYRWVLVNQPTVGKQYILVNTNQVTNSAKAVAIAAGTAEGGSTTNASIGTHTSGGVTYVDAWDGDIYSEFTMMYGMPNTTAGTPGYYGSSTFMFQNTGTGGYLFNDCYTNGYGGTSRVKVTYDPLHDTEPAETRITLASNRQWYQNYWLNSGNNLNETALTYGSSWVQLDSTGASDPQVRIRLNSAVTASTYPRLNLIYHPNGTKATTTSKIYIRSAHNSGLNETDSFYWGTGTDNWMLLTGSLTSNSDGYTWQQGTSQWNVQGALTYFRFDYLQSNMTTGMGVWLDSCMMFRNTNCSLAVGSAMMNRAWYGNSGFYPSHRWYPCQFAGAWTTGAPTSGQTMSMSGYYDYKGIGRVWQYFYGFADGYFTAQRGGDSSLNQGGAYFYEKQYTDESCTWQLVTSLDLTQGLAADNGAEYIICNKGGSAQSGATILRMSGMNAITTAGSKSVTVNAYSSSVGSGDTWRILRAGDYFYLQNKTYGQIILASCTTSNYSSIDTSNLGVASVGAEGGGISHENLWRYLFQYNVSSHTLTGSICNFNNCTSESENLRTGTVNVGGTTLYLYKKTFHQHNWGNWTYEDATNHKRVCGSDSSHVERAAHNWNSGTVTTAATCTTAGTKTYTCNDCGGTKTETIPATGHNWGGWTRISDTQHRRTCQNNTSHTETENHTWNSGTVTTAATCTTAGVKTYTCSKCNATKTESIPALNHNYGSWTYEDATNHKRVCANDSSHVERAAHSWNAGEVTTQPTCTAAGVKTYTCSVCNGTKTESVPALNHQWGNWESYGNADNHRRVCGRDNSHVETQAHTWVLQSGGTVATCTVVGSATYKCSVCNQTKSVSGALDPTNHDGHLTHHAATAATCVAAGNIEYWYCTACQKYFSNSAGTTEITQASTVIAIDANAHDWGNWTDAGAAGHTRVCSRDPDHHTETVAHTYPSTWSQGDATNHTKTCSVCSHVLSEAHTFGDWVVITPAAVGVSGLKRKTCSVCGKTVDEVIPPLTNPQMTVASVNTTQGSTVNVDVTLTGNTGIFAQNFVIYFPKTLTLNGITFSDDVYPSTEGVLSSPLFMDPVTNARMEGYFDDHNANLQSGETAVSKAGIYGSAIYIDNGAVANSTDDGTIITLSFTVPSGSSVEDYPIGIFGVYAPTDDAIDEDGDSLSMPVVYHNGNIHITNPQTECSTHTWGEWIYDTPATCTSPGERHHVCTVCGAVEYEYLAQGEHNYVATVTPPTCTEQGYTTHVCSVCGDTYVDTYVAATGHRWDNGQQIREASGLSGSVTRYTCLNDSSHINDVENNDATGTGISNTGDEARSAYYVLTNTITPGHEYIIANSNTTGTKKALTDVSGAKTTQDVTISTVSGIAQPVAAVPGDAYVWEAVGAPGAVQLMNKSTGNFLKAFNGTSGDNISLNLVVDATGNSNDNKFNSNGYQSADNYYLGYKDSITAVPTGVDPDDYAQPEGNVANTSNYMYDNGISMGSNFAMQLDVCFGSASDSFKFTRWNGGEVDSFTLGATSCSIKVGSGSAITSETYSFVSSTNWRRFYIQCRDGKLNVYVDGAHIIDNATVTNVSSSSGFIHQGAYTTGTVYVDNWSFASGYTDITYSFSSGSQPESVTTITRPSTWSNNQPAAQTINDVFTASTDANAAPRVYFYEKQLIGDAVEVYEKASALTVGDTYVLVDSNIETTTGHILNGGGTPVSQVVYSDGVDYTPYVPVAGSAAYEFVVTQKAGDTGYIINNLNSGRFLSSSGQAINDVTSIAVNTSGATPSISFNGSTYYLYKKTVITAIDTDLNGDFAVIDFGKGFTIDSTNIDDVIRANDDWKDRVDVTLAGIASSVPATKVGNKFFENNQVSFASPISLSSGNLTYGSSAITYTSTGMLEAVDTFYYGCTVDRLGAYMYGEAKIIPATSIYYEDTETTFISYDAGNNGATWAPVSSNDTINYLFEDIIGGSGSYGYNSDNEGYYTFSAGSAYKATVGVTNVGNGISWMPSVTFSFKGTGFEVFSASGTTSSMLMVEVKKNGAPYKNYAINNYYGYTYSNGEWVPVPVNSDTLSLYQVPIINEDFREYGEYTVKITVTYSPIFDHSAGQIAEFYFDGFRVFNPLGYNNSIANAKYQEDGEYDPKFVNLREKLIDAEVTFTGQDGGLFVDGSGLTRKTTDVADHYKVVGANEEVMLNNGQGLSFKLSADSIPDKTAIGVKVAQGSAGTLTISDGNSNTMTINVTSGTDMYYDITDILGTWTFANGGYESATITIANTSSSTGIISLTNIKFSSGATVASTPSTNLSAPNLKDTWMALADIFGVEVEIGDVDGDGKINIKDLNLIKKAITGAEVLDGYDGIAADMNGDGMINAQDLKLIKQAIAGVRN